jgi:ABC-type dipeptide/oligopeptide/nickel transport system permease subunit
MRPLSKKLAATWLIALSIICTFGPVFLDLDPFQPIGPPLSNPGTYSLLGTDSLGRDETARMIYGGRISLSISLAAVLLTVFLGGSLGFLAAILGGWTNTLIQASSDILIAIPGLLLSMLLVAVLGPGLLTVMLAVSIGTTPIFIRLSRSVVVEILSADYILASMALGANRFWIARWHILRNSQPHLIPIITNLFAWILLGITTLTFIGLGGDPSQPEWGTMLNSSRVHIIEAPWLALWPALAICLTILSVHSLGKGLTRAWLPTEQEWVEGRAKSGSIQLTSTLEADLKRTQQHLEI